LPANKQRSRIVCFRLSQEEYDSLRNASELRGARSVSEFTRSVACSNVDNNNVDEMNAIVEILRGIIDRMNAIERNIRKLTEEQEGRKQQAITNRMNTREKEPLL
jgi:uncharacterized protein (DUF1778 family)